MTVVVTGGSGRLGRSVLRRWLRTEHDVVNLDRVPSGVDGATDIALDLTDHAAVGATFDRLQPEIVIHLAAIAVPFSAPEQEILLTNTAMTYAVLTAAAASGARYVLASSSPTVLGYGAPAGWRPERLPLDETAPRAPWNAYALSKLVIEAIVEMCARRDGERTRFGAFRPCFVISPEEWQGGPTQQGHTVRERLDRPEHAAVSLFNYVDARDAADFTVAWVHKADEVANGDVWFVSAEDALARRPLAELLREYLPELAEMGAGLTGDAPAFSIAKAARELDWFPRRSWRTELADDTASPERTSS
jgi:nucleoside-diphosphate-sugar epimerase